MSDPASPEGSTRRQLLRGAAGAAALVASGCGAATILSRPRRLADIETSGARPAGRVAGFHSRPDLHPPTVTSATAEGAEGFGSTNPGLLFLGPGPVALKGPEQYGPLIVDPAGTPVWFKPLPRGLQVTNFASARYRGKPVLVWWEGQVLQSGYGRGEAVVLDHDYREIARVRAAGGRSMDLHALTLTAEGTALFTCYPQTVPMDLSSDDMPRNSQVLESIIQEVDIASGRLLWEWRSLQHIPVSASQEPHGEPYDYLHVNSIDRLPDGNLLVSARHTWALYKLDRRTGGVIWTLGGKHSQFEMGPGTEFAWQHDARRYAEKVMTVFDNAANGPSSIERESRGLVLEIDEPRRKVTLRHAYTSPQRLRPGAMGSVQMLSADQVLVGWGVESHTIDFAADGSVLTDIALPAGMYSYRGLWLPWSGRPHHRPAVAAGRDSQSGNSIVYASWNGATAVASWKVAAGSSRNELRPLGIGQQRGFETVIPLSAQPQYASVTALDHAGRELRRSPTIRL